MNRSMPVGAGGAAVRHREGRRSMMDSVSARVGSILLRIGGLGGEAYSAVGRRNAIRADTGDVLQAIVGAWSPTTLLELGTAYGLSTCFLALGSLSTHVHTVEVDENVAAQAREHFREIGIADRVTSWIGSSREIIERIPEAFACPDMVFLDHEKADYLPDTRRLLRLAAGHPLLVVADNVEDRRQELKGFSAWIHARTERVVKIPTSCGLLVAELNASSERGRWRSISRLARWPEQ